MIVDLEDLDQFIMRDIRMKSDVELKMQYIKEYLERLN